MGMYYKIPDPNDAKEEAALYILSMVDDSPLDKSYQCINVLTGMFWDLPQKTYAAATDGLVKYDGPSISLKLTKENK
jgi:hypothetical protein